MKRRDFIVAVGAVATVAATTYAPVMAETPKKKILYFDYSNGFVHPPTVDNDGKLGSCGTFLKEVGEKNGYEVVCTKDGNVFDGDLSQYAAFIFYTCGNLDRPGGKVGTNMSEQGVKNFYEAIRNGAGWLGFHSATDTWKVPGPAFENAPEDKLNDYIKMVGGQFIVHGSQQETELKIIDADALPSIKDFPRPIRHHDEWYCLKNFAKDMHVIALQETEGMIHTGGNSCYDRPAYPCIWVRQEGKGRVAFSSLGHGNEHWSKPLVRDIVEDLIKIVVKDRDVDMTPNFEKVCPNAVICKNPDAK